MTRLGFLEGAGTLFSAARRVLRAPRYWPYALVPSALFTLLSGGAVALIVTFLRPAITRMLGQATSSAWVNDLLGWVALLVSVAAGMLVALIVTTPLSAPALERLVAYTEADLGAPPRASLGFLAEMACGLRAQLAPLLWTVPAWVVLVAVDAAAPVLAPVTFAVRALLAGFGVAWSLIDYPLTLRGVKIRQRFAIFRRNLRPILGLGGVFGVLFWIPCCGIVFIGIGVVAATELVLLLAARDPQLRRDLGAST